MPIKATPTPTSDEAPPGPGEGPASDIQRSADARLARVHLRGGLLTLARAALEQMAGAGTLDRDAMADLAEVRWRSGDLIGAADAARAHQASGGDEPLTVLIIAEDLAHRGEDSDAQELIEGVYDRVGGAVDLLFAMEPRSSLWPTADDGWMIADAEAPGRWGLLVGGSEVADPSADEWANAALIRPVPMAMAGVAGAPAPEGRGGLTHPGGAASTSAMMMSGRLAGEELETVGRALAAGDTAAASRRLAVLLRLDPALAPVILSEADRAAAATRPGSAELSAIHLVRGDAYRTLGRDIEAAAAYQQAHLALEGGPATKEPT